MRHPVLSPLISAVTLATIVVACSKDALAPTQVSVFYSNLSTHINTGAPGTMIVTWLTPGTAHLEYTDATPAGPFAWYAPGFRTDTVLPGQVTCEHFEAPDDRIAVEFTIAYPGGVTGFHWASRSGEAIAWNSGSSWGSTGDAAGPAGSSDSFGGVVQGC